MSDTRPSGAQDERRPAHHPDPEPPVTPAVRGEREAAEVGYVGRDVEAIIRDLLEQTITEVHNDRVAEVEASARDTAEERILDALVDAETREAKEGSRPARHGGRGRPAASAAAGEAAVA